MTSNEEKRASVPDELQKFDSDTGSASQSVAKATGVPAADVFSVETFYDLLGERKSKINICTGLSCRMAGADELLIACKDIGLEATEASCLAACDRAPALLRDRRTLVEITEKDIQRSKGDWTKVDSKEVPADELWNGAIWPLESSPDTCAINLAGKCDWSGEASKRAEGLGAEATIAVIDQSGLQGRGGAGFPAGFKWKSVRGQAEKQRYVVLNADEAEPGTFKDREVMMRRPDLVLEGLAISARVVEATEIYLYLRGEFEIPQEVMRRAIETAQENGLYADLNFHVHSGQGAYICGEETALLESLEGKRGMPREKPPFPTEVGLWGKPTLIQNVETIACVPSIIMRGGEWFHALGKTEAGTKLYCISGHVARPGTYELPLGICLDDLVEAAGGYIGKLKAFSPGGASSGFLPASERHRPLDFKSLGEAGSMLGSAGVVILNESVDMAWAAQSQLEFFERESCGQCAPCRIGTAHHRHSLAGFLKARGSDQASACLKHVEDVAWEMREGSICGLGQIASLPLESARKFFPKEFE
ncbi:MAG: NADH:ubiquinone oxidoreductase subunit F (NADH-binding) [Planctomycetota bacterium]|jgi:NADH:ubiquinone oxidoreductase subunit F (NADH-binding)